MARAVSQSDRRARGIPVTTSAGSPSPTWQSTLSVLSTLLAKRAQA